MSIGLKLTPHLRTIVVAVFLLHVLLAQDCLSTSLSNLWSMHLEQCITFVLLCDTYLCRAGQLNVDNVVSNNASLQHTTNQNAILPARCHV